MKSDIYYIFCINTIKSLKDLQQINQAIIIIEENSFVIREPKNFYFDFDWLKNVSQNLKHEIEFTIKKQ